mgnify:CR=1 FL=1
MTTRLHSSYKVGKVEVDDLPREELIDTVRLFCPDAPDDLLRNFIKDLIDSCSEQLEEKGYAKRS